MKCRIELLVILGTNNWNNMNFKVNECNYKALQVWLDTNCHVCHGGSAYQSTVKLEWFMYTVWLVVPTSRYITLSIWIHTGVLDHADQRHTWCINMGTVETVLEAKSLCTFCLHAPLTDMTCQWHHGSYAEKVKIDERVGLARPRL